MIWKSIHYIASILTSVVPLKSWERFSTTPFLPILEQNKLGFDFQVIHRGHHDICFSFSAFGWVLFFFFNYGIWRVGRCILHIHFQKRRDRDFDLPGEWVDGRISCRWYKIKMCPWMASIWLGSGWCWCLWEWEIETNIIPSRDILMRFTATL